MRCLCPPQPSAKAALAEIYNAEDRDHAVKAEEFQADYGVTWSKAAARIIDDLDVLLAFYDFPAEHWIHLRHQPRSSLRSPPCGCASGSPKGPRLTGRRDRDGVQADRVRTATLAAVNAPHPVALVRAGARFERGILVEREPSMTGTEEAAQEILIHRS